MTRHFAALCFAWGLLALAGCASLVGGDPADAQRRRRSEAALRELDAGRDFAEFRAARTRHEQGDDLGAQQALERLVARNPKHREARALLVEIYLAGNRAADAVVQAREVLTLAPDDPRSPYLLGLSLEAAGQVDEAKPHYQRATELDPRNEVYRFHLQALSGGAVVPTAYQEPTPASGPASPPLPGSASASTAPSTETVVADAIQSLRTNQPAKAVDLLTATAAQTPPSATLERTLGLAYYRLGDYAKAQLALEKSLSLDKSSGLSYFLLGCTLAKLGQADRAAESFRQAAQLDPRLAVRQ